MIVDQRVKLTGEQIEKDPYQTFEVVLTHDNKIMIIHHTSLGYNGIVLDINGTSALDRLLSEMYRRGMK